MTDPEKAKALAAQDAIRKALLMEDWDPIRVHGTPEAQDEYDSYIGGVYRILVSSRSEKELINFLSAVEVKHMGLQERPRDSLQKVARCLLALNLEAARLGTSLFRILPGLPPYGPMARSFPPVFGNSGREGYVVEFLPGTPESWVGNFGGGLGSYTGVHSHPNGRDVVVFASGLGQVVDPRTGDLKGEVGGAVEHLWDVFDPAGFVLDRQGLAFSRIGLDGLYWHTKRLSWDGFKDVAFSPERITGMAWSALDQKWLPFEVDVATGRSRGGAYSTADSEQWERLAGSEEAG